MSWHAGFLYAASEGQWIPRLGVDSAVLVSVDGVKLPPAVDFLFGLCSEVANGKVVSYQRALPIAFTGAAGTGKTRAGIELPRLLQTKLADRDVSIDVVHRAVVSNDIDFLEGGERKKCPKFVALMLSDNATTSIDQALLTFVEKLKASNKKGMVMLLHVDEFQESPDATSAFLCTVRDLVVKFSECRILLMPVLSGFSAIDVRRQLAASSYAPAQVPLRTFSLNEAKRWARDALRDRRGDVDTPTFLAQLHTTGYVPRFVEEFVSHWCRYSAKTGPPAYVFQELSSTLAGWYKVERFDPLKNARVLLFVAALQRKKVRLLRVLMMVLSFTCGCVRVLPDPFACRSRRTCWTPTLTGARIRIWSSRVLCTRTLTVTSWFRRCCGRQCWVICRRLCFFPT